MKFDFWRPHAPLSGAGSRNEPEELPAEQPEAADSQVADPGSSFEEREAAAPSPEPELADLLQFQREQNAVLAEMRGALAGVEAQFVRAGKEQFKANANAEARQKSLEQLLERQREADAARDRELSQLRERLAEAQDVTRRGMIRDLLPVMDGLDEAVASGRRLAEQRREALQGGFGARLRAASQVMRGERPAGFELSEGLEAWLAGISLVRGRLLEILANAGVRPIPTVGELFDPHLHVAVETVPSGPAHPAGRIVSEARSGYAHGETVLRYAEVVVARAPLDAEAQRSIGEA
ncbi:MAG: nucleotide exchange factor GrpE [Actinomycetota bacterium]